MATSKFIPEVAFHPGETLAEKLNEMGMSIKEFAIRSSKPEKTIHAVIKGESSVTSDMAVAFENVTMIPARFWLSKQRNYQLHEETQDHKEIIVPLSVKELPEGLNYGSPQLATGLLGVRRPPRGKRYWSETQ